MALPYRCPQEQMKVSRVNIAINHDLLPGQGRQRGGNNRLTGPSLTADNNYLLHALTLCSIRLKRSKNDFLYSGKTSISGIPVEYAWAISFLKGILSKTSIFSAA